MVSGVLLHREPVLRPVRAYLRLPHFVGSTAGRKVRGRSVTTVTDPSSALSPEGVVNDCAHCEPIGLCDNGRGRAGADQGMDSDRHVGIHCSPVDRVWSCVLVLLSPPPDLLSLQFANSLMRFETFGCWSHIVPLEACVDRPTVRTTRMIRSKRFSVGPSCVLRKRSRRLHSELPSPS